MRPRLTKSRGKPGQKDPADRTARESGLGNQTFQHSLRRGVPRRGLAVGHVDDPSRSGAAPRSSVGLSKPRSCDNRCVYATPVIGTSRSVRRWLDLRPVPVKPDDTTTANDQQKAGAIEMCQAPKDILESYGYGRSRT